MLITSCYLQFYFYMNSDINILHIFFIYIIFEYKNYKKR